MGQLLQLVTSLQGKLAKVYFRLEKIVEITSKEILEKGNERFQSVSLVFYRHPVYDQLALGSL